MSSRSYAPARAKPIVECEAASVPLGLDDFAPEGDAIGPAPLPDDAALREKYGVRSPAGLQERCGELGGGQEIVRGLLPARCLGLLVGDSGLGKSPLAYQLALCVATGMPFLGHTTRHGRVLCLDYENGVGQVQVLLDQLADHLKLGLDKVEGHLLLWNFNDCPGELDESVLAELVAKLKPELVVIDCLATYAPEVEDSNRNAIRALRGLRCLVRDNGCTVLLVHHIRKPSAKPDERPAPLETASLRAWFLQARGAGAIINATDLRLGVDESSYADLVLRGFGRLRGEIAAMHLQRVTDEDGEPLGYTPITGVELLPSDQQEKYNRLPANFTFKLAQQIYNRGAQATTDFLKKCIAAGILRKLPRDYRKVQAAELPE